MACVSQVDLAAQEAWVLPQGKMTCASQVDLAAQEA